jgi:hypothetical protein
MSLICLERGGDLFVWGLAELEERNLSFTWSRSQVYQHDAQGKLIGYDYK